MTSAQQAAERICDYLGPRFQCHPCEMLDVPWIAEKVQSAIDSATQPYKQRIAELEAAIETIRDSVLHERHQLAEADLDCDQVNAVLGIIDDEYHPKEPTE